MLQEVNNADFMESDLLWKVQVFYEEYYRALKFSKSKVLVV